MLEKMKGRRFPDSGSESQPLLSSDASRESLASFGATCMFPDSETSDFEAQPSRSTPLTYSTPQFNASRRPFHYSNDAYGKYRGSLEDQICAMTYNRFQYYSKLRSYAPDEESALVIPDHVIPASVFVPYIPGNDQESGKQSSLVTIFAVWNTIMGSSLLTMPWGIERAGFWTGIILMILVGGLCLYTSYRLLQVHRCHGASNPDCEVSHLSRLLLGRPAEMVAKSFSLVVLLGANIVYWILMSNFLYHSVDYLYDRFTGVEADITNPNDSYPAVICLRHPEIYNNSIMEGNMEQNSMFHKIWDQDNTVPIFLIAIIGPLVNFKSATFFTKFNSLGTLSVLYLLIFVVIKASGWGINMDTTNINSPSYSPSYLSSFPALSGMLTLSFFIHNIIITIMRNNKNQENNGRDLSIAYLLVTLTYISIGGIFYVCFPLMKSCIEDNLLDNFQNWDMMTAIARVFLFFQLVTVYPLIAYMLRVQVFTTLMRSIYPGFAHVLSLNSIIIVVCVLFAIFFPRIGAIIRFTGAISGFIYIFTLPCLLHLASLKKQNCLSWTSTILHLLIPVIGAANLVAQFFVSDH